MEKQTYKTRIYKVVIRPIMTYTAETRPDTSKTQRMLETAEMRILRRITGNTLRNRVISDYIRTTCNVEAINEWLLTRRKELNNYISRMTDSRVVKIVRDKSPAGRRSVGRHQKRWSDNIT
ncbi:uncharacterized protein LOC130449021 [Diorhabda sublineata]|uniref:uncharacterized protein LOC130449021 n=1 Tax=Diorhabda sublineata TaxID=1163346 RepID=UPI0024E0876E|nr:uncharacterized protein LOC130449021 [Diorhabda sublineata]